MYMIKYIHSFYFWKNVFLETHSACWKPETASCIIIFWYGSRQQSARNNLVLIFLSMTPTVGIHQNFLQTLAANWMKLFSLWKRTRLFARFRAVIFRSVIEPWQFPSHWSTAAMEQFQPIPTRSCGQGLKHLAVGAFIKTGRIPPKC